MVLRDSSVDSATTVAGRDAAVAAGSVFGSSGGRSTGSGPTGTSIGTGCRRRMSWGSGLTGISTGTGTGMGMGTGTGRTAPLSGDPPAGSTRGTDVNSMATGCPGPDAETVAEAAEVTAPLCAISCFSDAAARMTSFRCCFDAVNLSDSCLFLLDYGRCSAAAGQNKEKLATHRCAWILEIRNAPSACSRQVACCSPPAAAARRLPACPRSAEAAAPL